MKQQRLDEIKALIGGAYPDHWYYDEALALLLRTEAQEAENARLRDALGEAFKRSTNLSTYKGVTNVVCHMCNTVGVESKGHADDCPFKGQEGVKE